uniref:Uncharacterized protein n=1 Tax=Anguilla anguilla TaxID=7936 RepID=A0A0E9VXL5_ANGAN
MEAQTVSGRNRFEQPFPFIRLQAIRSSITFLGPFLTLTGAWLWPSSSQSAGDGKCHH